VNPRALARLTAAGRIAIGAGFVLSPGVSMRSWLGPEAGRPAVKLLARALGARDLVLGVGALATERKAAALRGWLAAALVADATDFLATAAAGDEIPRASRALVLGIAGGACVIGAGAVAALGSEPPAA
jgi:hypothetical protein